MTEPVKVFVSYSWATENKTNIVDEIESECQQRGITLVRDRNSLKHDNSIKDFMNYLSKSNQIIIVISKAYLKSENCMYELLEMDNKGDIEKRTKSFIADDCKLHDFDLQKELIAYWDNQHKEANEKIKNLPQGNAIDLQHRANKSEFSKYPHQTVGKESGRD